MRIADLLAKEHSCLSFEVFPPKKAENYEKITGAALEIAALRPGFMSVTYGAGGSRTNSYTLAVAQEIQQKFNVPALAHLTCVGARRTEVHAQLRALQDAGIENILALRGDRPEGHDITQDDYAYAAELITEIKAFGGFSIGAACYPEGHTENPSPSMDRHYLKQKQDAGAEFFTTQMFFDNDLYYKFLYQVREIGVTVPVVAAIMPVTNGSQIERICRLSGTWLPARFRAIADQFGSDPAAMTQAGIIYACEQIIDLLAGGARHIHVYSMNKPKVAQAIWRNISCLI